MGAESFISSGALLLFGHLSDQVGRRPMAIAGMGLAIVGALVFLFARGIGSLYIGRILSGLAIGIGAGTGTAWLAELIGEESKSRATVIATSANFTGLGIGALLAGLLAEYAPWPLQLPYVVYLVALVAIAALLWANSPAWHSYEHVWTTKLVISLGSSRISADLRTWVNEGLMTLFFLVVGLEAKRQLDLGELRERRRLAIPVVAAIGGIIVPVLIYLAFNGGGAGSHGWGAAMSTDTAFALGAVALITPRTATRRGPWPAPDSTCWRPSRGRSSGTSSTVTPAARTTTSVVTGSVSARAFSSMNKLYGERMATSLR